MSKYIIDKGFLDENGAFTSQDDEAARDENDGVTLAIKIAEPELDAYDGATVETVSCITAREWDNIGSDYEPRDHHVRVAAPEQQ